MEQLIQTILSNTSSLVVVLDCQGKVEYASPSVKETLGYDTIHLKGKNWWKVTRRSESDITKVKTDMLDFLSSDSDRLPNYEQKLQSRFGTSKYILWDAIRYERSKIIGIGQDITLQKKTEKKLQKANEQINNYYTDLKDSLNYAGRLQQAILKNPEILKTYFSESFVLYKPKEVISGDLYWINEVNGYLFIAVIDCTGHGAPGALLSIITNSILKDLIIKQQMTEPDEILSELDNEFVNYLHENLTKGTIQDGMDIALMRYDINNKQIIYSSANRPIFILRGGEFLELKPGKFPIGFQYDREKQFKAGFFQLEYGDEIFLFTDGYADQFGGERNKKFNRKRFKQTLLDIQSMPGNKKRDYLDYTIKNWMQHEEQVDDITVMGLQV